MKEGIKNLQLLGGLSLIFNPLIDKIEIKEQQNN